MANIIRYIGTTEEDPGCGGCENGEHCGACDCCVAVYDRTDTYIVFKDTDVDGINVPVFFHILDTIAEDGDPDSYDITQKVMERLHRMGFPLNPGTYWIGALATNDADEWDKSRLALRRFKVEARTSIYQG